MAKSTICDVLSEVMVVTAVSPGLEAGFAQPVMTAPTQLKEYRDTWVVQFMNESEGRGKAERPNRSRSQDLDSCTRQESLDKVRRGITKLKSVVKKVEPLASLAAPPSRQEPSPKKKVWHKRTKKECFTACNIEKAMSIARADKEYATLMEERQKAAAKSPVVRSLFSETPEGTTQPKEESSSLVQGAQVQEPAE